jgi:protein TonB
MEDRMTAFDRHQGNGVGGDRRRDEPPTANDRLKVGWSARLWGSLILATAFHLGVFSLWPDLTAQDFSIGSIELEVLELPPEVEISPAPERISRPQMPIMSPTVLDRDITIGVTTLDAYKPDELPPPPKLEAGKTTVEAAMEREYPALLRDAGIGGTVQVWFFIDEEGKVLKTQVHTSSGHKALDEAALKVADVIRFSPALNREKKVKVWIALPITFVIR